MSRRDYRGLDPEVFILRRELAECIFQRHGVRYASSRFAKYASDGNGPQFTLLGRKAHYRVRWVDDWFNAEVRRKLHRPGNGVR